MLKKPEFKLELKERRGAMFETKPRYDVLLNGTKVNELYYNMTGYVGALPTPQGMNLVLRESGISTWKRELGRINREAKDILAAAETGPRVHHIFPTDNPGILFVAGLDPKTDELMTAYVGRGAMRVVGERFAGTAYEKNVPFALLRQEQDGQLAKIVTPTMDHWVLRACPDVPVELISYADYDLGQRKIDEIIQTKSQQTVIAVSRNEDGEPDLHFVDAWAAQVRISQYKSETKLSDMSAGEPAPVAEAEVGHRLKEMCPWFDPWAGEPVPERDAQAASTLSI